MTPLTTSQINLIDRCLPSLTALAKNGDVPLSLGNMLNDLAAEIAGGNVGINSLAQDIDSVCLGGGSFTVDPNNTSGPVFSGNANGYTFAWLASRFHNGYQEVSVSAGDVTLAASATNYVELDRNGTVYSNTSAWTAGRMPLYQVITGASGITSFTSYKPLLTLIGPAGVTGAMLSTAGATKSVQQAIGSTSTTQSFYFLALGTGQISKISFLSATAVASNNTNYWTFSCTNLGQANAGTQAILAAVSANTTKATGGNSLAVNVRNDLTLTTLTVGNELNVTAGDLIQFTMTASGAPTTIASGIIKIDQTFTN